MSAFFLIKFHYISQAKRNIWSFSFDAGKKKKKSVGTLKTGLAEKHAMVNLLHETEPNNFIFLYFHFSYRQRQHQQILFSDGVMAMKMHD